MLPQFKASGLAVVFDLTAHTFYPLRSKYRNRYHPDRGIKDTALRRYTQCG